MQTYCTHPHVDKKDLAQEVAKIRNTAKYQTAMDYWEVPSKDAATFMTAVLLDNSVPSDAIPAKQSIANRPVWEQNLIAQCRAAIAGTSPDLVEDNSALASFEVNEKTYRVLCHNFQPDSQDLLRFSVVKDNCVIYQCEAGKFPAIEPTPHEKKLFADFALAKPQRPFSIPSSRVGEVDR